MHKHRISREHRLIAENIGSGAAENPPLLPDRAGVIGETRASLADLRQGIAAPNAAPSPALELPSLTVKEAVGKLALSGLAAVNIALVAYVIGGGFYMVLTGKNPFPIGRKNPSS